MTRFTLFIGIVMSASLVLAQATESPVYEMKIDTTNTEEIFLPKNRSEVLAYTKQLLDANNCTLTRFSKDNSRAEVRYQIEGSLAGQGYSFPIGDHFHSFLEKPTANFASGYVDTKLYFALELSPVEERTLIELRLMRSTHRTVSGFWARAAGVNTDEVLVKIVDMVSSLKEFSTDVYRNAQGEALFRLPTGHKVTLACQ